MSSTFWVLAEKDISQDIYYFRLENNPGYMDELHEFKALHDHLDLWFSKYKAMVENREDVCQKSTSRNRDFELKNGSGLYHQGFIAGEVFEHTTIPY